MNVLTSYLRGLLSSLLWKQRAQRHKTRLTGTLLKIISLVDVSSIIATAKWIKLMLATICKCRKNSAVTMGCLSVGAPTPDLSVA